MQNRSSKRHFYLALKREKAGVHRRRPQITYKVHNWELTLIRVCKITLTIPLCGSESPRCPSRQTLAFRMDSVDLWLCCLWGNCWIWLAHTVWFCLTGLGFCSLLCPGWALHILSEHIIGVAPGLLSQPNPLQRRIYFSPPLSKLEDKKTWQLVANHRVCWSLPRKEKEKNPLSSANFAVAPRGAQQILAFQMTAKNRLPHSRPLATPHRVGNSWGAITQDSEAAALGQPAIYTWILRVFYLKWQFGRDQSFGELAWHYTMYLSV